MKKFIVTFLLSLLLAVAVQAQTATISGQVQISGANPPSCLIQMSRVLITVSDANANLLGYAHPNPFGYYAIHDVPFGSNYVIQTTVGRQGCPAVVDLPIVHLNVFADVTQNYFIRAS